MHTRLLGECSSVAETRKHLMVAEQTYYRWRNQYESMKADDAKRLKELEKENSRLKKIVADQALDIDILKEVNRTHKTVRPRARWSAPKRLPDGEIPDGDGVAPGGD